nr:vacuolar ATPase assembly integral membrane protein VMA21-like domain-containing protein [Tanacetum cinerariifolium]
MEGSEHFFNSKPCIGLRKGADFSEELIKKRWWKQSANERGSKFFHILIVPSFSLSSHVFASLVSDRGNIRSVLILPSNWFPLTRVKWLPLMAKFVYGFKNGDCGTGSQSGNTVSSPHRFVIHGIEVLKGNEKVTDVIDVKNWHVDNTRFLRTNLPYKGFERWRIDPPSHNSELKRKAEGLTMGGVSEKFLITSMLMWAVPIAILYAFNSNLSHHPIGYIHLFSSFSLSIIDY